MSNVKINCWSCKKIVSLIAISSNDGDCPKCNAEIDMYCIAESLQRQNIELLEALEVIMKCDQSDLVDYCRAVDSIACEAIAKAKGA